MARIDRRHFLRNTGLALAGLAGLPRALRAELDRKLRITEIEAHNVAPPLHDFNAEELFRYHGYSVLERVVFIVKTAGGLEGYGESGIGYDPERFKKYLDTSPFDWIAEEENLPINMAMYDLMGKYLGVPSWKLIGSQSRSWVPIAAWTVSRSPEAMAEEVVNNARRGYRWLKYHVDVLQNAVDQTEAMQKVAPKGFKVHYDFNEDSNLEAVYPVLRELERFPIAGRIEDPIRNEDQDGYRLLRQKVRIPILIHHGPHDVFVRESLCDGFMMGHSSVGRAIKGAGVAEAYNFPFMMQNAGMGINLAFLAHQAAVFRMATLEHVTLDNLWRDDVLVKRNPVVGGSVAVPTGPGLGIHVDRAKLDTYKSTPRRKQKRFIVRVRYDGGPNLYFRFDPDVPGANVRFLNKPGFGRRHSGFGPDVPGPKPGYGNPVVSDFWDDVGDKKFEEMWKRTESGPVWTYR